MEFKSKKQSKKISPSQLRAIRRNYSVKSVKTISKPVKVTFRTKSGQRVSFLAKKVYKKPLIKRK